MSDIVIKVDNLSKLYRIGEHLSGKSKYITLRDVIANSLTAPFNWIKNSINQSRLPESEKRKAKYETIWALKDVSFEIKQGEVVGIIGRNGAGKSTLLKILSCITEPTEGRAKIIGRIGSLLEVGTGFHPELTGRENIFLNGAILGMKKREIINKFDEIVAFAEVEKFIDTPVKFYSSGMYVRLAFAVAAHLEPEILLVDEVLAVGDVMFQKKCLGKMGDVAKQGRTVLFVSHNMAAIRNLCKRTILLGDGKLKLDTNTEQAIANYLDKDLTEKSIISAEEIEKNMEGYINRTNPTIRLKGVAIFDQNGLLRSIFFSDESINICITYECLTTVSDLRVIAQIVDEENRPIITTQNSDDSEEFYYHHRQPGVYKSRCTITPNIFGEKHFYISIQLIYPKVEHLILNKILKFEVKFKGYNNIQYASSKESFLRPQLPWRTEVIKEKAEVV